jgi:hypothetical protein
MYVFEMYANAVQAAWLIVTVGALALTFRTTA